MENVIDILKEGGRVSFSNDLLTRLVNASKNGKFIYEAGLLWSEFDFLEGQNALQDIDWQGQFILLAGRNWEQFDFESGLKKLEELDKNGFWTFKARQYWKLSKSQIKDILDKDIGFWAYIECKNKLITEKEALKRKPSIKWEKKIKKLK